MLIAILTVLATFALNSTALPPDPTHQRPIPSARTSTSWPTSTIPRTTTPTSISKRQVPTTPVNATRTSTSPKPIFPIPSVTTGPKDPCGPVIQEVLDPTIPNDTCAAEIIYSPSPATYGATLYDDGSGTNINYDNCPPVVLDVCASITDPHTPLGVWNWIGVDSACVMGFWLPDLPGAAPRSTVEQCRNQIFEPMLDIWMQRRAKAYNQVVVNLRALPDDSQTGLQVSVGYPSYTITYLPLIKSNQSSSPAGI